MPLTVMRRQSVTCCLGRKRTEVRRAREETGKALFGWGLAEHADLAEIIVSELVTNAIVHGEGPVMVRISYASGCLLAEVHDDGPGRPVRRQAAAEDESGRGLAVIEGLLAANGGSLTVTDDDAGSGKTVCAAIRLAGAK